MGALSGSRELEEFEKHLPDCPWCSNELKLLHLLQNHLRSILPEARHESATECDQDRHNALSRYHELLDCKFMRGLTRKEAIEMRELEGKLESEDRKQTEELTAGLHRDRELLRNSINELLAVANKLKNK